MGVFNWVLRKFCFKNGSCFKLCLANMGALFDIPKLARESQFCKTSENFDPKGLSPSKTNLHFFPCTFVISMFYPSFEAFCSENLVWKVHTGLYLAASRIDWTSSQGICHKGSQPLMVPAIILTFLLSAWTRAFTFLDYFEGCILCTLMW